WLLYDRFPEQIFMTIASSQFPSKPCLSMAPGTPSEPKKKEGGGRVLRVIGHVAAARQWQRILLCRDPLTDMLCSVHVSGRAARAAHFGHGELIECLPSSRADFEHHATPLAKGQTPAHRARFMARQTKYDIP
uniref:hypothetical protein n=1 Tax=Prosthecobacter sp. TaxID=1965333 RepID=UPI003784A538